MFDEWTNKMLAAEIKEQDYWDDIACRELCKRAGLETEWENADSDNFEEIIYHSAEILDVYIY